MIYKVFAIFDVDVAVYSRPFFMRSRGEALRMFTDAANDVQTNIGRYPASHTLFEIGEFCDETGAFLSKDAFVNLGNAIEFKNSVDVIPPNLSVVQ